MVCQISTEFKLPVPDLRRYPQRVPFIVGDVEEGKICLVYPGLAQVRYNVYTHGVLEYDPCMLMWYKMAWSQMETLVLFALSDCGVTKMCKTNILNSVAATIAW